jgi:hypothetical protein
MVVPLYIFFMCLVVETSLIILAKFGTNYAAYAGARSAIVHYSEKRAGDAEEWAKRSAIRAFVPFANGLEKSEVDTTGGAQSLKDFDDHYDAYRAYVGSESAAASERYMRSKYQYTNKHLTISLDIPTDDGQSEEPWLIDLTTNVEYRYSFHVPGVGILLGEKDSKGRFYTIHSSAALQSEAPKNEQQALGIKYEPWRDEQTWN